MIRLLIKRTIKYTVQIGMVIVLVPIIVPVEWVIDDDQTIMGALKLVVKSGWNVLDE